MYIGSPNDVKKACIGDSFETYWCKICDFAKSNTEDVSDLESFPLLGRVLYTYLKRPMLVRGPP